MPSSLTKEQASTKVDLEVKKPESFGIQPKPTLKAEEEDDYDDDFDWVI